MNRIKSVQPRTTMTPLLHALNIGTFATWLSVAGFGTVGIAIPTVTTIAQESRKDAYSDLESIALTDDFTTGDTSYSQATETGTTGSADEAAVPFAEQETLPTPPEMPETADVTPLPEIPDMPAPASASMETPAPAPTKPRPLSNPSSRNPTRSKMPTSATGGSLNGTSGAQGTAGNGGTGGGAGMSDKKRLAGGRMPSPGYPSEARSKGQTGTVLVEFIVGEDGRVLSAVAKSPSPWPILNECAVNAVRRWKFPPGSVTKYTRPIAFKLN